MTEIFQAVDLSGIAAFVVSSGVTIIGAALALKGIVIGKRAINKA